MKQINTTSLFFNDVETYLNSFINYEKVPFFSYKRSLKLERMKFFLEKARIFYQDLRFIHIAGTKGKGSTVNFCANLLSFSGEKVGFYTSPHLYNLRERIALKFPYSKEINLISKKELKETVEEIKPCIEKLKFSKFGRLTFFEILLGIAFKYFLKKKVNWVVLETGLGGRLDATNVVTPSICILTHIDYDHTDKLGKRLKDIAYEKSAIIKKNSVVINAPQRRSVKEVIKKRCKEMRAKVYWLGEDFFVKNVRINKDYTLFDFIFKNTILKNLKIQLRGDFQVENSALGIMSILLLKKERLLKKDIDFKKGLASTFLEARLEVIKKFPLTIVDIAHNPSSFSCLIRNLKIYFPKKRIILIFGASKDKDIKNMLNKVECEYLILTCFENPRAYLPEEIKKQCKVEKAFITKDVEEALILAKKFYNKKYLILVSGSLFLVSEAKRKIKKIYDEN
jgi:dihydrofolate synthase/folylpolyglutamate synthase